MNDQERLKDLLAKLSAIEGLDQGRFDLLIAELQRLDSAVGYDDTYRLKVVMFDARSYDIRSFGDRHRFVRRHCGRHRSRRVQAGLFAWDSHAGNVHCQDCVPIIQTKGVVSSIDATPILSVCKTSSCRIELDSFRRVAAPSGHAGCQGR